jgi:hypothetical protein
MEVFAGTVVVILLAMFVLTLRQATKRNRLAAAAVDQLTAATRAFIEALE